MSQKLNLFSKIRKLEIEQSIVLSLCLLERMHVNACFYAESHNKPDVTNIPRTIIDTLWKNTTKKARKRINTANYLHKIEVLLEHQFEDNLIAQSTADFLVALTSLIEAIENDELAPAVVIAKLSQGDIERLLLVENERILNPEEFREHELVRFEVEFIESILEYLQQNTISQSLLLELKASIVQSEVSNLGVSFES